MASQAKSLQAQGVPLPNRLRGPNAPESTSNSGPKAQSRKSPRRANAGNRRPRKGRNLRQYGPTEVGGNATASVGLLEAEFLGALLLLVMLMFANTDASYGDKIMSIMKRGTLVCFFFFILALIAGIGANAAKLAKALGALVFVTILLTTPVDNMITLFDKFVKADWVGSTEHGNDVGSADTGTAQGGSSASSNAGSGALGAATGAIERITQIMQQFGFGLIK